MKSDLPRYYYQSGISAQNGQWYIPDVEGRDNGADIDVFIHAVVPRHVETVVLMTKQKSI